MLVRYGFRKTEFCYAAVCGRHILLIDACTPQRQRTGSPGVFLCTEKAPSEPEDLCRRPYEYLLWGGRHRRTLEGWSRLRRVNAGRSLPVVGVKRRVVLCR
jgi:hypothetical protein